MSGQKNRKKALISVIQPSGPQPFWHQGLVSWKTLFPPRGVGCFGDDSSTLHLLYILFLFLLHQLHLRSSGIRSHRWGLLAWHNQLQEMDVRLDWSTLRDLKEF